MKEQGESDDEARVLVLFFEEQHEWRLFFISWVMVMVMVMEGVFSNKGDQSKEPDCANVERWLQSKEGQVARALARRETNREKQRTKA